MRKIIDGFIWISIFQLIGFGFGWFTKSNQGWYSSLVKSSLTPPNIVFPIAWGILYTLLALIGNFLWRHRQDSVARALLVFYAIQLLFNWLWTPVFFSWHLLNAGLIIIIIIAVFTVIIIVKAWNNYRLISYFILPYLFWLLFACYLNFVIWIYN